MLVLFILFGLLSSFSDTLETKYHIKGFTKGLVIAIPILFMSITSYSTGHILKKIKKYFKLSIISGMILVTGMLVLLYYMDSLYTYLLFFSLLGIGTGLVLPSVNTMVTSSCNTSQRGVITSLYGAARFIGVAIGPPAFTTLQEISKLTMYFGAAGISALILILALIFIKEKGMTPRKDAQGG